MVTRQTRSVWALFFLSLSQSASAQLPPGPATQVDPRPGTQTTSRVTLQPASPTETPASPRSPRQRFFCNPGYTAQMCQTQMAVLRRTLDRYHADVLGNWTWVLVRSEDWTSLKRKYGLNPDSPAFTALDDRATVFEEALVSPVAFRRMELFNQWSLGTDDLLQLAVTHELGHALCRERDEQKADAYGERLREGKPVHCR